MQMQTSAVVWNCSTQLCMSRMRQLIHSTPTLRLGPAGSRDYDAADVMSILPHALFQENRFAFNRINLELFYLTFNKAAINTAITVSTRLAVLYSGV